MLECTNNISTSCSTSDSQATAQALLDDPEFRKAFAFGMEAYFSEIEGPGHPLSIREVCVAIRHELDPKLNQRSQALCVSCGDPPISQRFQEGFLAGWVTAHTSELNIIGSLTT